VGAGAAYRRVSLENEFGAISTAELARPASDLQDTPTVEVEGGELHEFGKIELGAKGRHTFVLRNVGTAPLTLTKEGTTCKCTVSELAGGNVAPGESAEVTLEWKAEQYSAHYSQTATIGTNDPKRPKVELRISGSVVKSVALEPNEVRFSRISAGESSKAGVKILAFKDEQIEIVDLTFEGEHQENYAVSQRPLTTEELQTEGDAKSGYLLEIEVKPGLPLGANQQKLKIKTSSEFAPELELPISGNVVGDITVVSTQKFNRERNILMLDRVKSDEGANATIHLIVKGPHRDEVTVQLKKVSPDYLQVEVDEIQSLNEGLIRRVPVHVTIPTGVPAANFHGPERDKMGRVRLEVQGHPEIKEVDVGVYYAVE
ncbi:MAG: DUF1573 domain-containing protein, partial [Pirellulaceae bacterium]